MSCRLVILSLALSVSGALSSADELLVHGGPGFSLRFPKKHSRPMPSSSSVVFSMEYRKNSLIRLETEKLLQPIDLADPSLADIFLEVQLEQVLNRHVTRVSSQRIREFKWGRGVELVYRLPAWKGDEGRFDKVVEVITNRGSRLFRFTCWIPEGEVDKAEPILTSVIESFRPSTEQSIIAGVAPKRAPSRNAKDHGVGRRSNGTASPPKPGRVDSQVELGEIAEETGDVEAAVRAYGAAVRLDPSRLDLRFRLAVLLRRLGRTDEAIQEYKKILEADGRLSQVHYNLALVYLQEKNQPKVAARYFHRFLALDDETDKARQVRSWLISHGFASK